MSHDLSPAADPGRLYLITPARPDIASFLEAAVGGGVDLVQIRDPPALSSRWPTTPPSG